MELQTKSLKQLLVELDKASYERRGGQDIEPLPTKVSKKRKLDLENNMQSQTNSKVVK